MQQDPKSSIILILELVSFIFLMLQLYGLESIPWLCNFSFKQVFIWIFIVYFIL